MLMTTVAAELSIYGKTIEPEEITRKLGIQPSLTWRAGDFRSRRMNATYDYACWRTVTDADGSPLEIHVRKLIDRTAACHHLIRQFAAESACDVEVSVVVRLGGNSPDISLRKDTIEWIASIGASFDVDLYL